MSKLTKIRYKKNGFYKRVKDSSSKLEDCPYCKTRLVVIDRMEDYDYPNPFEEIQQKLGTMDACIGKCPKCGREFLEKESGDYDLFILKELEPEPESDVKINPSRRDAT